MYKVFSFSTSLPVPVVCFFNNSHLEYYEVITHCGLDLHFPDDIEHFFNIPFGHLYVFFGEMSFQILGPFLNWVMLGVAIEL